MKMVEIPTHLHGPTIAKLERLADEIEATARYELSRDDPDRNKLFALAWDIKQIARRDTPSEGV